MKKFSSRLIGITGGIATGKSTVTATLKELGYPVICADEIVHQLYDPRHVFFSKILKLLGRNFLKPDHTFDRQKIARAVFEDQNFRKKLEALLHPEVKRQMAKKTDLLSKQGHRIIFWDVPLLFEGKMEGRFEKILCVASSQKNQIERLKKRGIPLKEALQRIASQMPLREKTKKSHLILHNNRSKSELAKKVKDILKKIK